VTAIIVVAVSTQIPSVAVGDEIPKKGSTSYTTRYVFRPLGFTEVKGVGKITALMLVGTTQNTKGEAFFDKMDVKCYAIKVEGSKSYLDGACVSADADGDSVYSTFDSRELDNSQPDMNCGTHTITGGSGKYKGITGTEPFACKFVKETPPGEPYVDYRVDVTHNVTWEIK
jgi:hypothetical protein